MPYTIISQALDNKNSPFIQIAHECIGDDMKKHLSIPPASFTTVSASPRGASQVLAASADGVLPCHELRLVTVYIGLGRDEL